MESDIAAVIFRIKYRRIGKSDVRSLVQVIIMEPTTDGCVMWLRLLAGGSALNSTAASEDLQAGDLFWHAACHDKTSIVWMI